MTYVVNESCIKCKLMDCVEICPVDCFYEGENMLVIHPDECIDCGVCEPECPVDAIKPDTEPGLEKWLSVNARIRQAMAQYYPQEGTPSRCQRVGESARQGTIFLTESWRRHLKPKSSRICASAIVSGAIRVSGMKPAIFSLRSMAGSPKGSTRSI